MFGKGRMNSTEGLRAIGDTLKSSDFSIHPELVEA
jgi:hypothetical protein